MKEGTVIRTEPISIEAEERCALVNSYIRLLTYGLMDSARFSEEGVIAFLHKYQDAFTFNLERDFSDRIARHPQHSASVSAYIPYPTLPPQAALPSVSFDAVTCPDRGADKRQALIMNMMRRIATKLFSAANKSDHEVAGIIRDAFGDLYDLEAWMLRRIKRRKPRKKTILPPAPRRSQIIAIPKSPALPTRTERPLLNQRGERIAR